MGEWLWHLHGRTKVAARLQSCLAGTAVDAAGLPLSLGATAEEALRCIAEWARREPLVAQDHAFRRCASQAFRRRAQARLVGVGLATEMGELTPLVMEWLADPPERKLAGELQLIAADLQAAIEQAPDEYARTWLALVRLLLGQRATALRLVQELIGGRGHSLTQEQLEEGEALLRLLAERLP